ncbi:MAG TPA: ATP-dependent helicase [Anaerolineaceae bacterium]|nr:ATP-dependent helicase [Anaerolineaceae bacterium]
MLELFVSDHFLAGLDKLTADLKKQTLRKLELLAQNPRHPSLNAHQLERAPGKWECYITMSHRLIYEPVEEGLRLWYVGAHQIVDRVQQAGFASHTAFRRWQEPPEPAEAPPFEIPADWLQPREDRPPDNPFVRLTPAALRILGVPPSLVKAVQQLRYLEDLERLPELPTQSLGWLLDLATHPELEETLFDPQRLIFRATLDQLEGYCEGRIKRLMLNLSPEQEEFVTRDLPGAVLVRGCAGSGKTTVAVYRAIRYAERGESVIFLTFNKTLARVARRLIEELIGPLPDNLEVTNIDALLVRLLRVRGHTVTIVDDEKQARLLHTALGAVKAARRHPVLALPATFFRDEIARVIKGHGLRTEDDYLAIPRYGRKTALKAEARNAVWAVYEHYQAALQAHGCMDWQDVTFQAYNELLRQPLSPPYDHVIVDEGQDLTAMQVRVAQRLNKGGAAEAARTFFLVGDVAQTLYVRGFSWKTAGLQVQGRSFSLRRNFRNTREVAEAAAVLNAYNHTVKLSTDFVDPQYTDRQGPKPIVLRCDITDREPRAVYEKILDLVGDQTFRVSDFAILCPTVELCQEYQRRLTAADIPCQIYQAPDFDILEERVKVLTIHSAKGIEFPIIFLVGLHEGTLPRSPYQDHQDEEAALALERERTLLYVGMTRAAEALYLVTSTQFPSPFIREIAHVVCEEPFTGGKE